MGQQLDANDEALRIALSEHLKESVPEVDLWRAVQERLDTKYVTQHGGVQSADASEMELTKATRAGVFGWVRGWFVPYAWGAIGLVVLVIMAVGLAGLAGRAEEQNSVPSKRTPVPNTTPKIMPQPLSDENEYLFTLQVPEYLNRVSYDSGITVAEDGSFWIVKRIDESSTLVHLSHDGKELETLDLGSISDVELHDGNLWVSQGQLVSVFRADGIRLAQYDPIFNYPGRFMTFDPTAMILQAGGDGRMYVRSDGQFLRATNVTIGADGRPSPAPLAGYPGANAMYIMGNTPDEIRMGDKTIKLEEFGTVSSWSILEERSNGSFYVAIQSDDEKSRVLYSNLWRMGRFVYVAHYSADGTLIERARVSSSGLFYAWEKQIAVGSDGEVYAVGENQLRYSPAIGQVDLVRLRFYPASDELPPAPTEIPTPIVPTQIPTQPRPIDPPSPVPSIGVPAPTPDSVPTAQPPVSPLTLVRDGERFLLKVTRGSVAFGTVGNVGYGYPWLDDSRLLFYRSDGGNGNAMYLADLETGEVKLLAGNHDARKFISNDGKGFVEFENLSGNQIRVVLIDVSTGERQIVLDPDPASGRWDDAGKYYWLSGPGTAFPNDVIWISEDAFVLKVQPQQDYKIGKWSNKLLLVDIVRHSVRVLSEAGEIVGQLGDGTLLVQSSWMNGEVVAFAPPYDGPSRQVVPAGNLWLGGWNINPDGSKVAWLEMTPPAGDWSTILPATCCNDDPAPKPVRIAIWDSASGQSSQMAVSSFAWEQFHGSWTNPVHLVWSRDSGAIYFGGHSDDKHTGVYKVQVGGQAVLLAEHEGFGSLRVIGERDDGAVYYVIDGLECEYCTHILVRQSDGRVEQVYDTPGRNFSVDTAGRIELFNGKLVEILDTRTGEIRQATFTNMSEGDQLGWSSVGDVFPISPGGKWVAYAGSQSDLVVVGPDGKSDSGQLVEIAPIK